MYMFAAAGCLLTAFRTAGLLKIALDKPKEMGGGSAATNPEQVLRALSASVPCCTSLESKGNRGCNSWLRRPVVVMFVPRLLWT